MSSTSRGTGEFDSLVVRLVMPSEVTRFNELLDAHHYLGHNLVGRVLRYVAEEDGEWVALIGFGSPALSLRARERFVGWSEQVKNRRLRFVLNSEVGHWFGAASVRLRSRPGHRGGISQHTSPGPAAPA